MNRVANVIQEFNAGRDPERLAMKLRKMRGDPFIFLRGACHLFYQRLAEFAPCGSLPGPVPTTWVCGDLHLENFGSYKGDNRLVYFDLNDFDEAALAPCTWDVVRFLASVRLGALGLGLNDREIELLCSLFVDAYAAALSTGKARWLERDTATGPIADLLTRLRERQRADFLDTRTERHGKQRRIRLDGKKALPVSEAQRQQVTDFLADFARRQDDPAFFRVLDVARRIAGTGSLGVERYIVLVEGKGSPDSNYLLDLKQALPSSLPAALQRACPEIHQPAWRNEAERVVAVQSRMQGIVMAFLHAEEFAGSSYIVRGLQPSEDRVDLANWKGKLRRLEDVIDAMGKLTAWAHLRSGGRDGSAIADELIAFGQRQDWRAPLLQQAHDASQQTLSDWQDFVAAYDGGAFK
jgi:uncharacterized protein (DUF2252 family)